MFDMFGTSKVGPQHKKDFRKFEVELIKMCTNQCLKKERHYDTEHELCMTKCFDLAFIYTRIGLAELNALAYESNIQT